MADRGNLICAYLPTDRRAALAHGTSLPDRTSGAVLVADISGFTSLTEMLTSILGPRRGAEELARQLNRVYDTLIDLVERYDGSVITFSGDAITCWFDGDDGRHATACALAMQEAMVPLTHIAIPSQAQQAVLTLKVAVVSGIVRRFLVGDQNRQRIDTLAGATLLRLDEAEQVARSGEVVLDGPTAARLKDVIQIQEWRALKEKNEQVAVVARLCISVTPKLRPAPSADLALEQARPWMLPEVFTRLQEGEGEFLTELRPAVALFLHFEGIDYDGDDTAGRQLDDFICWVQAVLSHYGGSLLQLSIGEKGSYLYAAFGAPVAHEDDVVRAVRAAAELRSPPATLSATRSIRIGISQGVMRTGSYGSRTRRTYGVLGDAANLAARLMQQAGRGQVLVSEDIQQATVDLFSWRALPPLDLKGKQSHIVAFALQGDRAQRTFQPAEPATIVPMIGRGKELALLEDMLVDAQSGHGHLVGIAAEAGMGKSRLVAELLQVAHRHGMICYGGECESYGSNSPYLVWQPIWCSLFNLDASCSIEEQIQQLGDTVATVDPALLPRLPLLDIVLNLPIPETDFTRSFDPQLRKASREALLVDYLREYAPRRGLLLVLEDVHWIDTLSHDLLVALGRVIADLPILAVLAYRPATDQQAPTFLPALPQATEIRLDALSQTETAQLVEQKLDQMGVAIDADLLSRLVEHLIQRTQGNPFYIEELLHYLYSQETDLRMHLSWETVELPDSLHRLILSRIDQLTVSQQHMLKAASIIGRRFQASWLWEYYPQLGDSTRVQADLEQLGQLELIMPDQVAPGALYTFRHAITQEVTYESLTYATRVDLHEQFARYLEPMVEAGNRSLLDLLAHHYERSENIAKKREYLWKAGEAAQNAFANEAALAYYQRLHPLIEEPSARLDLLLKQGAVLELVGQWDEAVLQYKQALEQATQIDDQRMIAQCQYVLGKLFQKRAEYDEALNWLSQARVSFEAQEGRAGLAKVLGGIGYVLWGKGEFEAAKEILQQSLALAKEQHDLHTMAVALNGLGTIYIDRGDLPPAQLYHEESLTIRQQIGDQQGIAASLNNIGNLAYWQSQFHTSKARYQESLALYQKLGDKRGIAMGLANLGMLFAVDGDYERAQALKEEALAISAQIGDQNMRAHVLGLLGGTAIDQGAYERALVYIEEYFDLAKTLGAKWAVIQALNYRGSVAFHLGDLNTAHALLEEGLTLARSIDDKQGITVLLFSLSDVVAREGNLALAYDLLRDSIDVACDIDATAAMIYALTRLLCLSLAQVPERNLQPDLARQVLLIAGAIDAFTTSHHMTLSRYERQIYGSAIERARAALDSELCQQVWSGGQALTLEQAVALAKGLFPA